MQHQTSSRLLRMTKDDRPYTRDFKDLFSTLIVSLPLEPHRVRFKAYPFTFTSEEAITNLGSLKFSQSNRMPDPKDPTRIVTTTTTTTFSMAREMARTVCQRFMAARFIEHVAEKNVDQFSMKGGIWQLTPKGIHVLERFCQRNGISSDHIIRLLQSQYNTMKLVILERDISTDQLSHDKTTVEVIFRRFAGSQPNVKATAQQSDSDSLSDYADGLTGVKVADVRKVQDKIVRHSFTGKSAADWLLDCCTTIEPSETHEIGTSFVQFGLIIPVQEDKHYAQMNPKFREFQPSKNAIYIFADKGKRIAGWIPSDPERPSMVSGEEKIVDPKKTRRTKEEKDAGRETNTTKLTSILNEPSLRLLFREYLRETHCEENLSFYLDVLEFRQMFNRVDVSVPGSVREALAMAYGLYNAFLAPGSPCELNIDHMLRQDMASRMTRSIAKDEATMFVSLKEVATLFDRAQSQVFKLMAGDSVPKFTKTSKYYEVVGETEDGILEKRTTPERSLSKIVKNGTPNGVGDR